MQGDVTFHDLERAILWLFRTKNVWGRTREKKNQNSK